MNAVWDYFSSTSFMPHGHCYLWRPDILWMNVASDAVIAAAYFSIPVSLVYFVKRRRDMGFSAVFWLFAAFILLCGATHTVEIWTVWNPSYGFQGAVKAVTAAVSAATALMLWPLMPKALALPSTKDLTEANAKLSGANMRMEAEIARQTAELRLSEQAFRDTFDLAPVGIAHVAVDGKWLRVNRAMCAITGYDEADLIGKTFADITHPDDVEKDWSETRRLIAGDIEVFSMEKRYIKSDGAVVWVNVTASAKRGGDGIPQHLISCVDDITSRKRIEAQVEATAAAGRESELRAISAAALAETERRRLDAVLEAAPNGILVADATGMIVRNNPGNHKIWGPVSSTQWVEEYRQYKGWWADNSKRHGQPLEVEEWAMARALRGETVYGDIVEIEPFDRPGTRLSTMLSAAPVLGPTGDIHGAITVQTDISELLKARVAWAEIEANFQLLANTIPQLCWMAHGDGHIFWYNQRWYDYTGTTLAEMEGWGWQKVHHPEHVDRVLSEVEGRWQAGEPFEMTFPLRKHTGEYGWFLTRVEPLKDASGKVFRWFGSNTDISELRRAEEANVGLFRETQRAYEEAKRSNKMKDEFLATLSHELRTPLNAIIGHAELISLEEPGTADFDESLATIKRNAHAQNELISDLLDVSRIITGKLALDIAVVEPEPLVRSAVASMRLAAESKRVKLLVAIEPDIGPVLGDANRLLQVLWNLLSNAIKFTPSGGEVEIRLKRSRSKVQIDVADSGEGIEPAFLPYVFERFRQEDGSMTRRYGGLGLGLAIVRHIVELHGGTVLVESDGKGRGSTFTVCLQPLAVRPEVEMQGFKEWGAGRSHDPREDLELLARSKTIDLTGIAVLVVDDEKDARELVAKVLERTGAAVELAASAEEGLYLAKTGRFDVFVFDIGMPVEDGISLIKNIRLLGGKVALTPAIALTAYARREDQLLTTSSGYQQHLTKPVMPAVLIRSVAKLASR